VLESNCVLDCRPPALNAFGRAKVTEAEQRLTALVPDKALTSEAAGDCWLLGSLTAYDRAEDWFMADRDRVRALGDHPPTLVQRELTYLYAGIPNHHPPPTNPGVNGGL
jgi:hypothetical protein